MTSEKFVRQLRKYVVDDEVRFYSETLIKSDRQEVTDRYWSDLTHLYDNLNAAQKSVLLQLVRQVSVDTVASLLGIIDGLSYFEEATGQFSLTMHGDTELAGDLQEQFFMQEHDKTSGQNS